MTTYLRGQVISHKNIKRGRRIINYISTSEEDAVDLIDNKKFYDALSAKVNVDRVGVPKGKNGVNYESVSPKWFISPEAVKRTVQHTNQRGISKILHLSLSRRFKTHNRALRYNRLQNNVFTDAMQAHNIYRIMKRYAQLYSTEFGWSGAHPIKNKGDAHETLSLFFKRDGFPPKMVMYV